MKDCNYFQCKNFLKTDNPIEWSFSFVSNESDHCYDYTDVLVRVSSLLEKVSNEVVAIDDELEAFRVNLKIEILRQIIEFIAEVSYAKNN